jgi:glutamyl-tRNA reductase
MPRVSVLVVGVSHRSAPVALLERITVGVATPEVVRQLRTGPVTEAVVLATCNRVEVYADTEGFHPGVDAVSDLLSSLSGVPLAELSQHLYVHWEGQAVLHLFEVACGLDSMVVGESQILGQLRRAYAGSREGAGRTLHELFQQALRVGKRAHTETGIDEAGPVAGHRRARAGGRGGRAARGAVRCSRGRRVDGRARRRDAAPRRRRRGRRRQPHRRERRAPRHRAGGPRHRARRARGRARDRRRRRLLDRRHRRRRAVRRGRARRQAARRPPARPARPGPAARRRPGRARPARRHARRPRLAAGGARDAAAGAGVEAARAIVTAEAGRFLSWQRASRVAPTVVALRSRADEVVDAELARLVARLPELDDRSRAEVAASVRRVVDKLLHTPTVRVKELSDAPEGLSYADALRELFGLDRTAPAAVAVTPLAVDATDGEPV